MARPPVRRFAPRSPEPSRDRDAGTVPAAEERRCRSRVERSAGEETAVRSSDQRVRRHKAGGRCHVADRPHRANVKDGVQAPRTGGLAESAFGEREHLCGPYREDEDCRVGQRSGMSLEARVRSSM